MADEVLEPGTVRQAGLPYLPVGVAAAVVAVAAALPFPIEAYVFFRAAIAAAGVAMTVAAWRCHRWWWGGAGLVIAFLWVPGVLTLSKGVWVILDVAAAIVFLVAAFTVRDEVVRDRTDIRIRSWAVGVAVGGTVALAFLFPSLAHSGSNEPGPDCYTEVDYVPTTVCG